MAVYESSIDLEMPCTSVYNQWTQFEDFPMFMEGIESVAQVSDEMLHWTATIAGVRREWDARITRQIPDKMIAWESTDGPVINGVVRFEELDPTRTRLYLSMEYQPESVTEKAGETLGIIRRRVEGDLENFKRFLEERGAETGEWRGEIKGGKATTSEDDRKISLDEPRTEHAEYPVGRTTASTRPPTRET